MGAAVGAGLSPRDGGSACANRARAGRRVGSTRTIARATGHCGVGCCRVPGGINTGPSPGRGCSARGGSPDRHDRDRAVRRAGGAVQSARRNATAEPTDPASTARSWCDLGRRERGRDHGGTAARRARRLVVVVGDHQRGCGCASGGPGRGRARQDRPGTAIATTCTAGGRGVRAGLRGLHLAPRRCVVPGDDVAAVSATCWHAFHHRCAQRCSSGRARGADRRPCG